MVVVEADAVRKIPLEPSAVCLALIAQLILHRLRQVRAVGFVGLDLFVIIKHEGLLRLRAYWRVDSRRPASPPPGLWRAIEVSRAGGTQNVPARSPAGQTRICPALQTCRNSRPLRRNRSQSCPPSAASRESRGTIRLGRPSNPPRW